MMNWNDNWGWMSGAGWVTMVLFWGAFLAVVIWAVTRVFPSQHGEVSAPDGRASTSNRELLYRRLASGEIDAPTYRMLRAELESSQVVTRQV